MFKNKIALKLSIYFAIALLVFSIIIGVIFASLFRSHTIDLHKNELAKRANSISQTLTECMANGNDLLSAGNSVPYLHFLGDIAGTDVWIVDENLRIITGGTAHGFMTGAYQYADLPQNADVVIKDVFQDKTVFSEDFSGVLSELTLTVGVPIKINGKNVVGVVLLHSSVRGINEAINDGSVVLITSILVALLIALLLSVGFSITFTKPLNKIKNTALLLAEGNYKAKNNIKQKDEIGQLGNTLDILADRLDLASKQSEKLEQLRQDFVANISHELRTPITVMRGSLEALADKVVTDPKQVDEYYCQMLNETLYLQRLVGDLLDLSRLQNMDFVIEKQEISMTEIIDDVIRSAAQLANKRNVKINLNKDNSNRIIYADYGRIRQMFLIVLDNAIKFSQEGGTVDVMLKSNATAFRDYGVGIPKDDLPYIFDRFYKSRSEQNKTGTGLGLSIAKQIANRHDIKLTVDSKDISGTEFKFEF